MVRTTISNSKLEHSSFFQNAIVSPDNTKREYLFASSVTKFMLKHSFVVGADTQANR